MLEENLVKNPLKTGHVILGTVMDVANDHAVIDVNLKAEGRVPLSEFEAFGHAAKDVKVGDKVDVYLENTENAMGEAMLSYEKAQHSESWNRLEKAHDANEHVQGVIYSRVKGGFMVDLKGVAAFLPNSQLDIYPIHNPTHLMNVEQPFQLLKMDRVRSNVVVSRRAIIEGERANQYEEKIQQMKEGDVVEGVVKNITDYGAFIDIGHMDGLLHVTDMLWRRIRHPSEVLSVGQSIKVKVIKINHKASRVSLGMKQLEADPWESSISEYTVGKKFTGKVTNITDYGAFIELESGVEGLLHVSEMSWLRRGLKPEKFVTLSQEVEVMVLDVDHEKKHISFGMKQCLQNPWTSFAEKHKPGDVIETEVKNITDFGLFVGLEGDVDGMIHMSDLDWKDPGEVAIKNYSNGQRIKAVLLDVNVERGRVSLGVKQLEGDPLKDSGDIKRGKVVTCEVIAVQKSGIEVMVDGKIPSFIRRVDLSRDRSERRPERFAVGDRVDATVVGIDAKTRRLNLSIKTLEVEEEKDAIARYGSSDSGASLGDVLGVALAKKDDKDDKDATPAKDAKDVAPATPAKDAKGDKDAASKAKSEEVKEKAATATKAKETSKPESSPEKKAEETKAPETKAEETKAAPSEKPAKSKAKEATTKSSPPQKTDDTADVDSADGDKADLVKNAKAKTAKAESGTAKKDQSEAEEKSAQNKP